MLASSQQKEIVIYSGVTSFYPNKGLLSGIPQVEEKDMISDKDIVMKMGNLIFMVRHHYMMGNYLHTTNSADVPILEHLANSVIKSV